MALHALRDLLVVPRHFFETRRSDALKRPALGAVLLTAVVTIAGLGVAMQAPLSELPSEARGAFLTAFVVLAVATVVVTLVGWGLVAGVVHLLVRNHAPTGTYGRTFAVVGLAALVEIPAILGGFVEAYLLLESVSFADPERALAELDAASGGRSPLSLLAWTAVTLWQGYIWREGLLGVYDVGTDRATLAAGVAVVVTLLVVVSG